MIWRHLRDQCCIEEVRLILLYHSCNYQSATELTIDISNAQIRLTSKTDLSILTQEVIFKDRDNQLDILIFLEVLIVYVRKMKIKEYLRNSLKVLFLQINLTKEDFKLSTLMNHIICLFHIQGTLLIILFHMMVC